MSKEVLAELRALLSAGGAEAAPGAPPLPQLFLGGRCIAGPEALERLTQQPAAMADELRAAGALARLGGSKCDACGGQSFLICPACRGSRKARARCAA